MHQLDAEAVAAEATYNITNTQPGCSGGGESDRIPNTFEEIMGLPQSARCKEALTLKGSVFSSNIMLELGTDKNFGGVQLYIDNTSALHVPGNRTYSLRAKHIV